MGQNLLIKLGERIRSLRKTRDLSQEELAEKASLHFTYVGRIERGEVTFSVGVLYGIAVALGVNIDKTTFSLFWLPINQLPKETS
ncbi:helix-turn-helix domain-containing protein [bacterium]|nr:helix-turn-helix domain-containing protein [bacterium]MBU1613942.1 helix-turn-helix domain-containing protein [bacterium]